jgi:Zn-dependent protease with chaperone function
LGVFPVAAAIIFALAFLLPAYLLFYPYATKEVVTYNLGLPALISLFGISAAIYRIFGVWWKTRQFVKYWSAYAEPISIENVKIPAYCIPHQFPIIAVVGIFRPRMFIARQIFASLSEEEIRASLAHEYAHLAGYDNFKRTLMRICRDLLVFPMGKTLERAWTETAESAADEYAAQNGGNLTAVNLASALVKIAKIVPEGVKPAMPAGAFLIAEQTAHISSRVRNLLQLTEINFKTTGNKWFETKVLYWIVPVAFVSFILFAANNPAFLKELHDITESIIAFLQ